MLLNHRNKRRSVGTFWKCWPFYPPRIDLFGGPVAHLGYFREEIVIRRKWVDERTYGDLIGLCQFLPGPASSQAGISLGIMRAGLLGGLMAWVGFTLPSAILLTLFAYWASVLRSVIASGNPSWLDGRCSRGGGAGCMGHGKNPLC